VESKLATWCRGSCEAEGRRGGRRARYIPDVGAAQEGWERSRIYRRILFVSQDRVLREASGALEPDGSEAIDDLRWHILASGV
jgi:hypothetical protein